MKTYIPRATFTRRQSGFKKNGTKHGAVEAGINFSFPQRDKDGGYQRTSGASHLSVTTVKPFFRVKHAWHTNVADGKMTLESIITRKSKQSSDRHRHPRKSGCATACLCDRESKTKTPIPPPFSPHNKITRFSGRLSELPTHPVLSSPH